ncbi:hypothetical protein Cgig2_009459 [Carnegiea gigantea]|uniref:Uncharacterized protein n=1 Tax=Carnegiea gigantea TaxID=171969 RepID=A0A9Q1QDI6_9CARY|nr:hypothetical protein Cgig2_009459 [Carnegiea gigantea]
MWALHDECGDIVKNIWKERAAPYNAIMVEEKIEACTVKLVAWNKTEFNHVQSKIQALEHFPSSLDSLMFVHDTRGPDEAGDYIAVLWEVWNSRNWFIFNSPDLAPKQLARRAITLVHDFREARLAPCPPSDTQVGKCVPPPSSIWKLNFDAG